MRKYSKASNDRFLAYAFSISIQSPSYSTLCSRCSRQGVIKLRNAGRRILCKINVAVPDVCLPYRVDVVAGLSFGRAVKWMQIHNLHRCRFLCRVSIYYFHVQKSSPTPQTFMFTYVLMTMKNELAALHSHIRPLMEVGFLCKATSQCNVHRCICMLQDKLEIVTLTAMKMAQRSTFIVRFCSWYERLKSVSSLGPIFSGLLWLIHFLCTKICWWRRFMFRVHN
jgi:hypothetical protein